MEPITLSIDKYQGPNFAGYGPSYDPFSFAWFYFDSQMEMYFPANDNIDKGSVF